MRRLLESSAATVDELSGEAGFSALMYAAWYGQTVTVRALLQAKASVDLRSRLGHTALMAAAWNGHTATVQALLQASASVDLRSNGKAGFSALMYAAWYGHTAIVRALLQAKASVDLQSKLGYTALMVAAWNGRTAVVQALLQASASVDLLSNTAAGYHGRVTALMFARNRNQAAAILLLQGQSLRTCRAFGQRARGAAARIGTAGKHGAQRIRVSPAKLVEMGPPLTISNAVV